MKIVSHKVAKLAKEKGFNEKCDHIYIGTRDIDLIQNYGTTSKYCYQAPILTELQNWLLTTHNIWVEPILNFVPKTIDDYGFRVCLYSNTDQWNGVKWQTNRPCGKIYKTPWEALDVGLYEALLLIK